MTEVHQDFGPLYPFSDFKKGEHVSYRVEGSTQHGEILWVVYGHKLPSGRDMPPHYVVLPDGTGDSFPDMVLFSDVVMKHESESEEPVMEACPYCFGKHPKGTVERCPLNPNRRLS